MNNKTVVIMTIISIIISTCTIVASFAVFTGKKARAFDSNPGKPCYINVFAEDITMKATSLNTNFSGIDKIMSENVFNYTVKLSSLNTNSSYYFVWSWEKNSDKYYKLTKDSEYTISIVSGGKEIIKETQLPNFDDEYLVLGNDIISSKDEPIEKVYTVIVRFYNIEGEDQSSHLGKNYTGSLHLENIACT